MAAATIVEVGAPLERYDARRKVMGEVRYGADMAAANEAYAYFVTSRIARGRIVSFADQKTRATPGVLDLITYREVNGAVKPGEFFSKGGYASTTIQPLGSDRVMYSGQIIAIVLAESFEAAQEGARNLEVTYDDEKPTAGFDSVGAETVAARMLHRSTRTPRLGTPNPHSNPPKSKSTRVMAHLRSITIRSSSLPRSARGAART
jgi:xanthine dehydrogenase YagR molybdenum-binding subunit